MKTIGVIGGIGPQATTDFEARLHRVSQELIPQRGNGGYPGLVVYYLREPPVVLGASGEPVLPLQPTAAFLDAARWLGQVADFLVITSNGAHVLQPQVEATAGKPVLSMVDLVVEEVQRRGWQRAGLLTMGPPIVYSEPLTSLGLACEALDAPEIQELDRALIGVMEGKNPPESIYVAVRAVDTLRGRSVDGIVLGCTELPLLLGEAAEAPDLLNPIELLVEAAIRRAIAD
jgi:aspartate racemase